MQARYYPWAIAGGTCVTIAPGTLLWLVPLAGALAHMAFDATSPEERAAMKQHLLGTAQRLQLPMPSFGGNKAELLLADQQQAAPKVAARKQGQPKAVEIDPFEQELAAAQQPRIDRDPLLHLLEGEPHRLVLGHTRGGKTTLIHDMATNWSKEGSKVIVCDPDAMPGIWPGCTVVGHGNDIEKIEQIFAVTLHEYERRQKLRGEGQREFSPIHLIVDEAQDVIPYVSNGTKTLEAILRRGAKHGIFLTVGVHDKQVGTLGLEGKSELLKNFIITDVLKDPTTGQRQAIIKDAITGKKNSYRIPKLLDPETLIATPKQQGRSVETVRLSQPHAAPKPVAKAEPKPDPSVEAFGDDDPLLAALVAGSQTGTSSVGSGNLAGTGTKAGSKASQSAGTDEPNGNQTMIIDDGRNITIHNTVVTPSRETRNQRQATPYASRRRESHERYRQVRKLVKEGKNSTEITGLIKGRKKDILALIRQAKAELGKG